MKNTTVVDPSGYRPTKAYYNLGFLKSRDARLVRILSEYLEPASRLQWQRVTDTIVFFGSARACPLQEAEARLAEIQKKIESTDKPGPALRRELRRAEQRMKLARYYEDAVRLAAMVVKWAKTLNGGMKRLMVCSGGGPGIMEAANRGAREAGGQSIGFSISLPTEQKTNPYVPPELAFEFHYFFMRKFWFVYLAKAMVIFPGGFGTMDEAFEVLTLTQTRKTRKKMPVVFYGSEYWRSAVDFEMMERWGTISAGDRRLVHYCDDPVEAFEYLKKELTRIHGL
jgi:uncharacterized protein (TIGR00730 family)